MKKPRDISREIMIQEARKQIRQLSEREFITIEHAAAELEETCRAAGNDEEMVSVWREAGEAEKNESR